MELDPRNIVKSAAPVFENARVLLPALILAAALLASCSPAPREPVTAATWFPLRVGSRSIEAQLAVTPEEMQTGLMHRASLPQNSGMLFVYESPRRVSFWMMNTLIPLDVGFFTPDGVLREVRTMRPNDLTSIPSARSDIQFALEMNAGWFEKNNIRPDASLDLRAVADALRQRQFDPSSFGLPK